MRMPLPQLDKVTGVISKDSDVAMEKLHARYGSFITWYDEHWEKYRELQGQVNPGVMAFAPESSASLMKRASASSVSHPTTSDMCCQTDDYWVKILESEDGTSSSILDDEDDRDLDSDDASILRQLKNPRPPPVAKMMSSSYR
ncbi:hypothetical protein B0O80DRAFT_527236 [Mortierella sp. GBAus27b]|nr:hypothetical protein B0O80DRAFT_527236 [Mortierella sp. GBAus27b]